MYCCSCWPSTPPGKEFRVEQIWGTLYSGKIWQNRSSDSRYFQEPILWAQFSYLLISRKARKILHGDNCVLWLTETFCKKRCAWSYLLPFYQNHILTDLSLLPLWSSLRATWNVASQAIVFILPQYKVTCKSHVVHFFKVSPGNE